MEFFRKNQKLIIGIIALCFVMWTVGPIILALLATAQR